MRITENMRYQNVLHDIAIAQQRMFNAQEQVSSGKKITKPSDDPIAASDILRIHSQQTEGAQYLRNLNFAKSKLEFTDSVFDSAQQLLERAVTLGQLSFTLLENGANYADELDGLRDHLIATANYSFAGRFIFGGSVTTQQPYVKNADSSVSYQGNSELMPLEVSRSVTLQTQIPGNEVFSGPLNVFDVLANLRAAIRSGDKAGIDAQIHNLQQFGEDLSVARGKVGGYLNRSATVGSDLAAAKITQEKQLTAEEAADMAAAITELTASEQGFQATLAVGARISQLSLLDFLR